MEEQDEKVNFYLIGDGIDDSGELGSALWNNCLTRGHLLGRTNIDVLLDVKHRPDTALGVRTFAFLYVIFHENFLGHSKQKNINLLTPEKHYFIYSEHFQNVMKIIFNFHRINFCLSMYLLLVLRKNGDLFIIQIQMFTFYLCSLFLNVYERFNICFFVFSRSKMIVKKR